MKKTFPLIIIFFIAINNIFSQKIIEMNYENGIYTIPCKVNGIPMKFIFDTGASDVSISLTEAKFLIKQGLLQDKDIKGTVKYKIANGEIEKGTKIILKEINIDGLIIKNVEASIVHQLNAPLLLGQSAISKLGTFQLNGNKLIINSDKTGYFDFLDINLTHNIEDFGFSLENLSSEKKFTPVDFETLKISKTHFLKKHEFDSQKIIFHRKGNIAGIILEKFTPENIVNKEEYSKTHYNSIIETLNEKFWIRNQQNKNKSKSLWKSKELEIALYLDNREKIRLIYFPKGLISNSSKSQKLKNSDHRQILLDVYNKILSETTNETIKRNFVRFDDDNLEAHMEVKVNFIVKEKDSDYIMERMSYHFLKMLITENKEKNILLKSDFNYLIFKIQIKDENYERKYSQRKISKRNLEKLKVPFSEREIIEILEK